MAVLLAKRLGELGWIEIVKNVETNMIWYKITDIRLNGDDLADFLKENGVLMWNNQRFVVHHDNYSQPMLKFIRELAKEP